MTTTSIQTLATEVRAMFHESTRTDGTKYWTYDHSPDRQWIQDMCLAAHGDMSPDDWRYAFIVEALDALSENEDSDDVDLEADIYTHELTAWLGSRADRYAYCDQWIEDTGGEFGGTIALLSAGQYTEKREVLDSIRASLSDRAESLSDDSEDATD